jgi:acetyl esterase/lipase
MPAPPNSNGGSTGSSHTLLSEKALALSLSAPRAPPHGSAHRQILLGKDPLLPHADAWRKIRNGYNVQPSSSSKIDDDEEAHAPHPHHDPRETLRRLAARGWRSLRHPHLPVVPPFGDQVTRALGGWLPVTWTNHIRDTGGFRSLCDVLVTASVPLIGATSPSAAARFGQLTRLCKRRQYGPHPLNFVDLYLPTKSKSRLVVFIHGGAWGSGLPWMYRLVATSFVEEGWAVAIPSYRTYPDGQALDQVEDVESALTLIAQEYPELVAHHVSLMGHSSGAHIGLLLLVERARQQALRKKGSSPSNRQSTPYIQDFVGLSGPYDISHHFDYEAARGVEELSPMKAACGMTRTGFRHNSPALRLLDSLADNDWVAAGLPPSLLLVHAIEDETVPFTATAEAARVLRSCGVPQCQELYLGPGIGHQDTVMQLMIGGPAREAILASMKKTGAPRNGEDRGLAPTKTRLVQQSKL